MNILSLKNRGKYFHFKKTFLFKHLVFIILASFLFFSLVFYFQSGAWRKYTSQGFVAESEIASNFDSYLRENEFSGAALIVKNGQLLLNKGYGFSNRTVGSKITPETKFPIGSISKQFTAAAILILESQGKLKLEDSICQHLSDCPKDWNGIAIFHLLTNSSGLGDYLFDKTFIPLPWCNISQSDLNRAYEKGKQQSLLFTPGMKFSYSNVGYHLLGDIIENTSGQNYESFLKENIFSKLELTQTGVGEKDLETVGYINKYLKACNFAFSGFKGEGSLFTTTGDFLKWLSIFKSENLLSREVILKMIKPYYPADPEVTREQNMGYGLGVGIIKLYGKNLLTHGGFFSGYKALYEYSPDSDTVLILLTNDQSTDLKIFQDKIAGDIFNN